MNLCHLTYSNRQLLDMVNDGEKRVEEMQKTFILFGWINTPTD